MFQLIELPLVQSASEQAAVVEPTHTLIYRGTTYEVPQKPAPAYTQEEKLQLIGKRLCYRGTSYEIVPTSMSTSKEPKVAQKLCYRGVTFWSSTQSNPSIIEYAVV